MNTIGNLALKLSLISFIVLITCALLYGFSAVCNILVMLPVGGVIILVALYLIILVCCHKSKDNKLGTKFNNSDAFYCIAGKYIADEVVNRKDTK